MEHCGELSATIKLKLLTKIFQCVNVPLQENVAPRDEALTVEDVRPKSDDLVQKNVELALVPNPTENEKPLDVALVQKNAALQRDSHFFKNL